MWATTIYLGAVSHKLIACIVTDADIWKRQVIKWSEDINLCLFSLPVTFLCFPGDFLPVCCCCSIMWWRGAEIYDSDEKEKKTRSYFQWKCKKILFENQLLFNCSFWVADYPAMSFSLYVDIAGGGDPHSRLSRVQTSLDSYMRWCRMTLV